MSDELDAKNRADATLVQLASMIIGARESNPTDKRIERIHKTVMAEISTPGGDLIETLLKMVGQLNSKPSMMDQREADRQKIQADWHKSLEASTAAASANRAQSAKLQQEVADLLLQRLKNDINPATPTTQVPSNVRDSSTNSGQSGPRVDIDDEATSSVPPSDGSDERGSERATDEFGLPVR